MEDVTASRLRWALVVVALLFLLVSVGMSGCGGGAHDPAAAAVNRYLEQHGFKVNYVDSCEREVGKSNEGRALYWCRWVDSACPGGISSDNCSLAGLSDPFLLTSCFEVTGHDAKPVYAGLCGSH